MKFRLLISISAAALAGAAPIGAAQARSQATDDAETAGSAGTDAGFGDIVVTAQRRAEALREVPISVSAFDSTRLAEAGINNVSDLAQFTPGLKVSAASTARTPVFAIRGQVQTDVTLVQLDSSVALYLDDVYISRPAGQEAAFLDLARVEVLKGPQGTLFGRNTSGGAVRLITNRADVSQPFEGRFAVQWGTYGRVKAEGAANIPLVPERLAVRVAASNTHLDGYGKSLITGEDTGQLQSFASRVSLAAEPVDGIRMNGMWQRSRESGTPAAPHVRAVFPGAFPQEIVDRAMEIDVHDSLARVPTPFSSRQDVFSGEFSADISDDLTLDIIYGRAQVRLGSFYEMSPLGQYALGGSPTGIRFRANEDTAEARISGSLFDDAFDFQTGVYYLSENGSAFVTGGPALAPQSYSIGANKAYSVFAQGTWRISDGLFLTGGIRYNEDKRKSTNVGVGATASPTGCPLDLTSPEAQPLIVPGGVPTPIGQRCAYYQEFKGHTVPWLGTLRWEPSRNHSVYLRVAKGYRSGGVNGRGVLGTTFTTFLPESVLEYEVGYKGDLFDNVLRLNVAAFLDKRRNGQASRFVLNPFTGGTTTTIGNVVNIDIKGFEADAALRLTPDLTLSGSVAYIDKNSLVTPTGFIGFYVPKFQGTASLDYSRAFSSGELSANVDYSYTGRIARTGTQAIATAPAYHLVNARIGWSIGDSGAAVAIFGKNLLDEDYVTQLFDVLIGPTIRTATNTYGAPREFGVEFSFRF